MLQVWIFGTLCNVTGYIERADWSAGITGDSFIIEHITDANTGKEMLWSALSYKEIDQLLENVEQTCLAARDAYNRDNYPTYSWIDELEWDEFDTKDNFTIKHQQWLAHWIN